MQDEVNEKVVSLCIRGGKISAQILKASLQKLLREMEQSQKRQKISGKGQKKETVYHGKQSMEKLKAHNQELSNIEVTDGNIRSFEKYARKYDIDYCLKKDRSAEPPKYYVFFKAKEVDSITAAFKEYTGWQLKKSKKVSVRKKLYLAMERVAKHRQREKMKQKNRITEGVIWKQLLIFFFPIVIGTFFQQVYNTADSIVVGRFVGKEALAAVSGSVNQIVTLIVEVFVGLTSGASVIIAQFYGAKDHKNLNRTLHTAYAFAIVTGAIVGLIGFWITEKVLIAMKTPSELMADSVIYLHIYFCGMIFNIVYNMGASILRAVGDSRRPLYVLIMTCGLNICCIP